ncbi:MAG: hypothetical protein HRT93_03375 [Piscirickettsiaceae bacterium]|nr:hypothetical protein [Piscirickettsiaceae bacterium]
MKKRLEVGKTMQTEFGELYAAGIDVPDLEHSNAIECYGETVAEAEKLRDYVLKLHNKATGELSNKQKEKVLMEFVKDSLDIEEDETDHYYYEMIQRYIKDLK